MFCSNCGKEVSGNFCSYCGAKLNDISNEEITNINYDNYVQVNGHRVDIGEILERYNGNKVVTIKHLRDTTGAGLREAKEAVDNFCNKKVQMTKEKVKRNKDEGVVCCPKCSSTSLSAHKKGFGIGKAVVGAWATGGIGLMAGNIGAKKVRVTCLNCGHQFMAGKK